MSKQITTAYQEANPAWDFSCPAPNLAAPDAVVKARRHDGVIISLAYNKVEAAKALAASSEALQEYASALVAENNRIVRWANNSSIVEQVGKKIAAALCTKTFTLKVRNQLIEITAASKRELTRKFKQAMKSLGVATTAASKALEALDQLKAEMDKVEEVAKALPLNRERKAVADHREKMKAERQALGFIRAYFNRSLLTAKAVQNFFARKARAMRVITKAAPESWLARVWKEKGHAAIERIQDLSRFMVNKFKSCLLNRFLSC
jgi:hypothetical protein